MIGSASTTTVLVTRLRACCAKKGFLHLPQLGVEQIREFRRTWSDRPGYAIKNLERLRTFFRFCESSDWIARNPAKAVKAPKPNVKPTLPFTHAFHGHVARPAIHVRGADIGAVVVRNKNLGVEGFDHRRSQSRVMDDGISQDACVPRCKCLTVGTQHGEFSLIASAHNQQAFRCTARCFKQRGNPAKPFVVQKRADDDESALCAAGQFDQAVVRVEQARP
jgi:hypothetical protein